MPGVSAKDQCFEDATQAYEDATGKKLGLDFQRPWVKDGLTGKWGEAPAETTWDKIMGSILKTLRITKGDELPRAPGVPNPVQVRYPDITMTQPDGTKIVIDNKFTDSKGNIDKWGTKPGTGGQTQPEDYRDINKQNTGNPNAQEISLDENECGCKGGEPEPETVPVPMTVPFPGFLPMPAPGTLPGGVPAPEPVPVPEFIPEFLFAF